MLHAKHKHSIAYVANPVGRPLIYHLIQSPPEIKGYRCHRHDIAMKPHAILEKTKIANHCM